MTPLITVKQLSVCYDGSTSPALSNVSLTLAAGESVAVIGPSGSGKSTLGAAIATILPPSASTSGEIRFGDDLLSKPEVARAYRGSQCGIVFQEPEQALNPVLTIGRQLRELIRVHTAMSGTKADTEAIRLLERVKLDGAERLLKAFPHELSGGMQQRVVIALALAGRPALLIADEPTASLDYDRRDAFATLIDSLRRELNLATLWISHDLEFALRHCERALVLKDGELVDSVSCPVLLDPDSEASHRHLGQARELWGPVSHSDKNDAAAGEAVLEVRGLCKKYRRGQRAVTALDSVDLTLRSGECVGITGLSGSGKSTLARCIVGFERPDQGEVKLVGDGIQFVFQASAASLDPRGQVRAVLDAPLRYLRGITQRTTRNEQIAQILTQIGLDPSYAERPTTDLSGGERQRINIARALLAQPALVVADEPFSALDLETQLEIVRLLGSPAMKPPAMLIISHDHRLLNRLCNRVLVMKAGKLT